MIDTMKTYEINFNGCSCGCTPSKNFTIKTSAYPGVLTAIARLYYEYRTWSGLSENKYRKVECKQLSESQEKIVIELADKFDEFNEKIKKLKNEIKDCKLKIKKYEMCAETLGVTVPQNKTKEIQELENTIHDKTVDLKATIKVGNTLGKIPDGIKITTLKDYYDDIPDIPEEEQITLGYKQGNLFKEDIDTTIDKILVTLNYNK